MRTETVITLYLTDEEYTKLRNAEKVLEEICDQFDLDPAMRKYAELASDAVGFVCEYCERERK